MIEKARLRWSQFISKVQPGQTKMEELCRAKKTTSADQGSEFPTLSFKVSPYFKSNAEKALP